MQFEQETNDGGDYLNENNQNNLLGSSSYGQQAFLDFGNSGPMRNYYKKSKSIPFRQINLYGNIEQDFGINGNNIGGGGQMYSNHHSTNSNLNVTSSSYIQQLRQQQSLQYSKYQQSHLNTAPTSSQFYSSQPNIQYQQLARGLRINSASSTIDNSTGNNANNNYSYRDSTNRSPHHLSSHPTHLTNKTSFIGKKKHKTCLKNIPIYQFIVLLVISL